MAAQTCASGSRIATRRLGAPGRVLQLEPERHPALRPSRAVAARVRDTLFNLTRPARPGFSRGLRPLGRGTPVPGPCDAQTPLREVDHASAVDERRKP